MVMDSTTEAISHFAGLFNLVVESQRGRMEYDDFLARAKEAREQEDLVNVNVYMRAPHDLQGFDPHVNYVTPPPFLSPAYIPTPFWAKNFYNSRFNDSGGHGPHNQLFFNPAPYQISLTLEVPALGSIAVLAHQINRLTDNDFLSMVDTEVETISLEALHAGRQRMESEAAALDPIGPMKMPGSEEAIGGIVEQVVMAMEGAAGHPHLVASGEAVAGVHVNGEAVDEAPKLSDYLPSDEETEDEGEDAAEDTDTQGISEPPEHASGNQALGAGEIQPKWSLEFESGGNRLVNEAHVASAWADASVFAVMGSAVSLDVISQVNVWSDCDSPSGMFSGVHNPSDTPTQAFNVASFITESTSSGGGNEDDLLPANWSVTRMEGNVVLLNWLEQINLVSDNDVAVLSETGSESYIQMGGNLGFNQISLFEIGFFYDLVVIGGNMYNANIISQSNVLLDCDYVSSDGAFETAWHGQLATQNNLLWNSATIKSVGQDTFKSMPGAYRDAAGLDEDDELPEGVLGDEHLAGNGYLSVLYIEGHMYDLQYINQKNVLGDADQIAMVAQNLEGYEKTEFQLDTGGNELINIASIIDIGMDSTVYVGDEVYNDAFLYQSEMISNDPLQAAQDPQALANEAVLFLAEGLLEPGSQPSLDATINPNEPEYPRQVDILQTLL